MDISMEELLQATIDEGGSDLHIRAYMPPKLRVHGALEELSDYELTEEDRQDIIDAVLAVYPAAEGVSF